MFLPCLAFFLFNVAFCFSDFCFHDDGSDQRTLERLWNAATVKPAILQNRFYAESGWDIPIRMYCRSHSIVYQSFWTLTGNVNTLQNALISQISLKHNVTAAQVWFRFCMHLGITPLTGTTNELHMKQDLAVSQFNLSLAEVQSLASLIGEQVDALHDSP